MLIKQLRRIQQLADADHRELAGLASRIRLLCIPANRWIVRAGSELAVHLFLLQGSVTTSQPRRKLKAGKFGWLPNLYPGAGGIWASTTCHLVCIDTADWDILTGEHGCPLPRLDQEQWLQEFLLSNLMRRVPRILWRNLLASFKQCAFDKGAYIIRSGEVADCCFVVEHGHGVIRRGSRVLRYLNPGDFFGEDGLILNAPRNADVVATERMVLQAISLQDFSELLLERVVRQASDTGDYVRLNIAAGATDAAAAAMQAGSGEVAFPLDQARQLARTLDFGTEYMVQGGECAERALCAFILAQAGHRVVVQPYSGLEFE